jgi:hypothetical protein
MDDGASGGGNREEGAESLEFHDRSISRVIVDVVDLGEAFGYR